MPKISVRQFLQSIRYRYIYIYIYIYKRAVGYRVLGSLSEEHLDNETVHSRNLSNSKRLGVATELTEKSVSKYFNNQFNSTKSTNLDLNFSTFNNIKSSEVLRKAKFDLSSLQRYSNDNWSELISFQQNYQNTILRSHADTSNI